MTKDISLAEYDVNSDGIYGKFFRPSDHYLRPGIIVLGGSGGGLGWSEGMAQKIANEGYAVLALAYFRFASLPKALLNIPLEYIEKSFDWMAKQEGIDVRKLTLVGGSRGAELALLLATKFPVVKAVICYAPSSVIWGACGGISSIGKSAWTYQNKPLKPIRMDFSFRVFYEHLKMGACLISRFPYRETPLFTTILENKSAVKEALISVENIKGPVLLISGDDDQLSPSTLMSEMIIDRLRKYKHPFFFKHLICKGAGHAINLPDLPYEACPTKITNPLTHIVYDLGGDPDINASAGRLAWNEVVAFLKEYVAS